MKARKAAGERWEEDVAEAGREPTFIMPPQPVVNVARGVGGAGELTWLQGAVTQRWPCFNIQPRCPAVQAAQPQHTLTCIGYENVAFRPDLLFINWLA